MLELKAKDMFGAVAIEYARSVGHEVTHTLAFVDNTTAEHVSERGKTQTEALHQLRVANSEKMLQLGVHEATDRVASVDNDIADLLSRGAVEAALVIPKGHNLKLTRLEVPEHLRDTSSLSPTWA